MKDLIERLRECAADSEPLWSDKENQDEAADAIERLTQERDEATAYADEVSAARAGLAQWVMENCDPPSTVMDALKHGNKQARNVGETIERLTQELTSLKSHSTFQDITIDRERGKVVRAQAKADKLRAERDEARSEVTRLRTIMRKEGLM